MIKEKRIMPWCWVLAGIMWDVWYYIARGRQMLDSDMSSEMILSSILNDEHPVMGLTSSWRYGEELRFINIHWFLRIGLMIFPDNWHLARTVGTSLSLLVMAFSMWLVFYAIGRPSWGAWATAFTVFPGGSWYFWQTIYGGYYMVYITVPLLTFSLIVLTLRNLNSWKNRIYGLCSVLLGLCMGLNGIKAIMLFYAPLILATVLIVVMKLHFFGTSNISFLALSVLDSAAAGAGYLINSKLLSQKYFYADWSEIQINYKSILEIARCYLWSFGYAENKPFMSMSGIAVICGVFFGGIVFLSGSRLLMRIKDLKEKEQLLVILSITCIVFCCFVFSYSEKGDIQYFQPIVPYGYILVVIEIFTEKFSKNVWDGLLAANIAMLLLAVTSAGTIHNEADGPLHNYRARPTLQPVVDYLVEQGYTQGVALFWTANLITELSNGRIDMWTLNDPLQEYKISHQRSFHLENDPEGRWFYIFDYGRGPGYLQEWYDKETEVGMTYIENHPYPTKLREIYSDDDFVVYGN